MENIRSLLKYKSVGLLLTIVFAYVVIRALSVGGKDAQLIFGILGWIAVLFIASPEIKKQLESHLSEKRSDKYKWMTFLIIILAPLWIYLAPMVIGDPLYPLVLIILIWLFTATVAFCIYFVYRFVMRFRDREY